MAATLTDIEALHVDGTPRPDEGLSPARVQLCITRILEEAPLCAWATVTNAGEPHINTAYFAHSEDLELYFLSHPGSLHCRNVSANPSVAVAVFKTAQQWTEPGRGLQLFGLCGQAVGVDAVTAERVYGGRFQAYDAWKMHLTAGDVGLAYRFYCFRPDTVKILDEAEFGDAVWVRVRIRRTPL